MGPLESKIDEIFGSLKLRNHIGYMIPKFCKFDARLIILNCAATRARVKARRNLRFHPDSAECDFFEKRPERL